METARNGNSQNIKEDGRNKKEQRRNNKTKNRDIKHKKLKKGKKMNGLRT
jgi:hypothetical protein